MWNSVSSVDTCSCLNAINFFFVINIVISLSLLKSDTYNIIRK